MAALSIAERLDADLKQGMRDRAKERISCIRQLRSKAQEATNAKGFSGEQDDAFYQKIIAAYIKQLRNGIEQLVGDKGAQLRQEYTAEIDFLEGFLPKPLDRAETTVQVRAALAELKIIDPKQSGRVLGHLMKQHPGQIDPQLARTIVAELLT
jgi:uncharacterized protein YqeY